MQTQSSMGHLVRGKLVYDVYRIPYWLRPLLTRFRHRQEENTKYLLI